MAPEDINEANEYGVEIAKYLDEQRALKDISFKQMSEDLDIAITRLQRFFLGKDSIGYGNFIKIVRYLRLKMEFIKEGEENLKEAEKKLEQTRTDVKPLKSIYGDISEYDSSLQYAYENLCNAVIETAVDDYRELKRRNKEKDKMHGRLVTIAEIEKFFLSNWFGKFTTIDGGYLLNLLRKE